MVKTQIYCLFRTKYNLSGRPNLVTDLEQRRDRDKMFFLMFDDVNENRYHGGDNNHGGHGDKAGPRPSELQFKKLLPNHDDYNCNLDDDGDDDGDDDDDDGDDDTWRHATPSVFMSR